MDFEKMVRASGGGMMQPPSFGEIKTLIDGVFYFVNQLDEYEKKKRYDDNARRFLENAFRLYEQGQMTREQLKAVVDLLPSAPIEVQQPRPVQQPIQEQDLSEILKKVLEQ